MHLSLWRVVPGAYLNSHHQNFADNVRP